MTKFKAVRDGGSPGFCSDTRISGLRDRIISSKEYEECYPEIGVIRSIRDHKGDLSVRVDSYKFKKSSESIQGKFINMIKREWCEAENEPLYNLEDAKTGVRLFESPVIYGI